MIVIAVRPIARPAKNRSRKGSAIRRRTGESGCSSSIPKRHAEIMKIPSAAASMRYSGQCCLRALIIRSSSQVRQVHQGCKRTCQVQENLHQFSHYGFLSLLATVVIPEPGSKIPLPWRFFASLRLSGLRCVALQDQLLGVLRGAHLIFRMGDGRGTECHKLHEVFGEDQIECPVEGHAQLFFEAGELAEIDSPPQPPGNEPGKVDPQNIRDPGPLPDCCELSDGREHAWPFHPAAERRLDVLRYALAFSQC